MSIEIINEIIRYTFSKLSKFTFKRGNKNTNEINNIINLTYKNDFIISLLLLKFINEFIIIYIQNISINFTKLSLSQMKYLFFNIK